MLLDLKAGLRRARSAQAAQFFMALRPPQRPSCGRLAETMRLWTIRSLLYLRAKLIRDVNAVRRAPSERAGPLRPRKEGVGAVA